MKNLKKLKVSCESFYQTIKYDLYMFDFIILDFIKIIISIFVGVLFCQSGFDKIIDFKGNKSYIEKVFAKSPLHKFSNSLFYTIIILEILTGILCFVGAWINHTSKVEIYSIFGLELATVSILSLFVGQRIAKDYAGAAALVPYFILVIMGLFVFSLKGWGCNPLTILNLINVADKNEK